MSSTLPTPAAPQASPPLDAAMPLVPHATNALVLIAAFTLCAYLHLSNIGGDFLSDDFAHAGWIAEADGEGGLLDWLVKRFYQPLESGNFAYRPIAFLSYALDWLCYGTNAAGWHLTNLLVHLLNGGLVYALAGRLTRRTGVADTRFAAASAASLFLAIPFAGESTFWPVGRFDLLAATFSLGFLWLLLGDSTATRARGIAGMLLCLLLALLSKESAMPMLVLGFLLVFAFSFCETPVAGRLRAALTESARIYSPVLACALGYFAWRYILFGSPWKVYPDSHLPGSIGEFVTRVSTLRHVMSTPYGEHWWLWSLLAVGVILLWIAGLPAAIQRASQASVTLTISLFTCALVYLLAPASSFAIASATGEGVRNLYFPWLMFSLFAGFALAHHRLRVSLLCCILLVSFWGQWRLVTLWQSTAAQMLQVTSAIPALGRSIAEHQFALLLLPDNVHGVPFVRTAQAGVVMPPRQATSTLYKVAAMTPLQFAEWEQHLANNVIGTLKGGVAFNRADFSGVYCWLPRNGRFQLLAATPQVNDAKAWEAATLREATRLGCLL